MRTCMAPCWLMQIALALMVSGAHIPYNVTIEENDITQDFQPTRAPDYQGCSHTTCIVNCLGRPGITVSWEYGFTLGSEVMMGLRMFCKKVLEMTDVVDDTAKGMPTCAAVMKLPNSIGGTPMGPTWEVRNTKSDKWTHIKHNDMKHIRQVCQPKSNLPIGPAKRVVYENQVATTSEGTVGNITFKDYETVHMHLLQDFIISSPLPAQGTHLSGRMDAELDYARNQLRAHHLTRGVLLVRNPAVRDIVSTSATEAHIYSKVKSLEDSTADYVLMQHFRGATETEADKLHNFLDDGPGETRMSPVPPSVVIESRSGNNSPIVATLEVQNPIVSASTALASGSTKAPRYNPTVGELDTTFRDNQSTWGKGDQLQLNEQVYNSTAHYRQDGCYPADAKNASTEWEQYRFTVSVLSKCTKESMTVCKKCCPLAVPMVLDSSNDVCFIEGDDVKIEGVIKETAQDFDMCHVYCRLRKNGTGSFNTPLYRSTVFRSPFLNMKGDFKSSLEDMQLDKLERSGRSKVIDECWTESMDDFMSDDQRIVQHLAATDSYSRCDNTLGRGTRDTVYVPASCIETGTVALPTAHMQAYGELSAEMPVCTIPVRICYSPHCTVSFTSTSTTVSVNMKSKYAKFQISDGHGGMKRGYFTGSKIETIEFDGPGAKHVQGVCNQRVFERNIMFTEREYCDEMHPGYSNMFNNVYCKRPKTVKICATVLLASTAAYLSRHLLRGTLGVVVSAMLFIPTTYLLDRYMCKRCYCYKFFKNHKCHCYRCKYCAKIFMTANNVYVEDRELEKRRNDHYKVCTKDCGQGTTLECAVSKTYQLGLTIADVLFKIIPGAASTTAAVILIILVWSKAEASTIANDHHKVMGQVSKDLSPYIEDLKNTGYHPYFARNFDGNREDIIGIHEENDCGNKVCHLKMRIETELIVTRGREFGFTVWPKKNYNIKNFTGVQVNVRFTDPQRACTYKDIYSTGKPVHGFRSKDTCTEGCSECINRLHHEKYIREAKKFTNITYSQHENTASWACDGPGCMAINQGCTCGACFCRIEHSTHTVRKLVKEAQSVNLCIQVGGEGFCKRIGPEERTKHMNVIKSGEPPKVCPDIIACEIGSHHCYEGAIADLGDFSNKFGNPKLLSDNFTVYAPDVQYTEQCLFAKHRWFQYSKCCVDTHYMVENLRHVGFVGPKGKGEHADNVLTLPTEDAGTWKFSLSLPPFIYNKEQDTLEITNLRIDHCSGCHSCDEGGSCLLSYRSNFDSTPPFSCKGVRTDVNTIRLKKGSGVTPFNIFAGREEGNLTCSVGGATVTGGYRLVARPKHPHGDGVIKITGSRVAYGECGNMFCGSGLAFNWDLNPFNSLKDIALLLIAVAVICFALYIFAKVMFTQYSRYRTALQTVRMQ